ncbi:helix-turn-helix domain-containing protein [Alistipes sp.]|uniref:helix-turn-helix domain-containing protein n=1 Tax=Alistipes sp. TaxID=1872444 RepID=UPI003AB8A98A
MAKFRIKEICRDKGITQKELAEKIGITAVGLAKAIAGNTTIGTLEKVADALGVDIVELFAEKEDFVAFVRDRGQIYVFDSIRALKEFTDAADKTAGVMRELGEAADALKEKE